MFAGAENFNGDISDWDVSQVYDMRYSKSIRMFENDLTCDVNRLLCWEGSVFCLSECVYSTRECVVGRGVVATFVCHLLLANVALAHHRDGLK